MAARTIQKTGATLGADEAYDTAGFVKQLGGQGVTPHVAQKTHSAIDKTDYAPRWLCAEHQEPQAG